MCFYVSEEHGICIPKKQNAPRAPGLLQTWNSSPEGIIKQNTPNFPRHGVPIRNPLIAPFQQQFRVINIAFCFRIWDSYGGEYKLWKGFVSEYGDNLPFDVENAAFFYQI